MSKAAGFKDMADYVNQKCGTKWTGNNAQSRFKAWLKNFKEIKRQYMDCNGEKYCLSQDDFRKKVYTIEAKLDNDCPFYNRMDNLFGERQNVVPSYVMQSTEFSQLTETQFTTYDDLSSDEDGEDNEEIDAVAVNETVVAEAIVSLNASNISTPSALSSQSSSVHKSLTSSKRKHGEIPEDLKEKSAAAISDCSAAKIIDQKKSRKDFGSCYVETKTMELSLLKERFDWEKENSERNILEETKRTEIIAKEDTKRSVMMKLIEQGKSPNTIKRFLTSFGFDI